MPDTPTPNPSDPDPSAGGDASEKKAPKEQPRLKLKRLVVKDLEIHPHINPDAEPVPHAVPVDELEDEPEVKPELGIPQSIEPVHPPVVEEPKEIPEEPEAQTEEPEKEEPVVEAVPAKKSKKQSTKKILLKKVLPITLIAGSLIYGVHIIFDPLGFNKPEPIIPRDIPIAQTAPSVSEDSGSVLEEGLEISRELSTGEVTNLTDYLALLAQQEIRVSNFPAGVFINSVFYAPGTSINPDLGLSFVELKTGAELQAMIVAEDSGTLHEIPFQLVQ